MPYPWDGAHESVLRIMRSMVPRRKSVVGSATLPPHIGYLGMIPRNQMHARAEGLQGERRGLGAGQAPPLRNGLRLARFDGIAGVQRRPRRRIARREALPRRFVDGILAGAFAAVARLAQRN